MSREKRTWADFPDPDRWDLTPYSPKRRRWPAVVAAVLFAAVLCAGATSGEWLS